ncbi:class F sortase [Pseudonocardia sp. ICBG1142]|uniref:class F sortase n=1 Tax=Pseudonocardia sp. ICBG1142 TaxID=2846760 RepID=UPI001CF63AF6|nr:class F sortase [Pseudonocardia sp. ICBG1142]
MTRRRRRPAGGVRGAAALLLLGVVLLGSGAGLALGGDSRLEASDLGAVPAEPTAATRAVPAARVLPVLAPPDPVAVPGAPAPIAPREPWTVSAVFPRPAAGPGAAAPPVVPAVLELPARGLAAPVDAVGTAPDGGMVVPEQVRTVGWWAPGVLPGGTTGSAVIAGHVDSRTQGIGFLSVLPQLVVGEPVVVRGADGRTAGYRVVARREYGKHDLPREVFRRDGDPQLVLITCGGVFDPAARSYESNIVVYAVPEP